MTTASILPVTLRPGITNPDLWNPDRPPKHQWERIRQIVLSRDDYTCMYCRHRAMKYMHVHHVADSADNHPDNLVTLCVACHAVMHAGRNLALGAIEIWESDLAQADIVRTTRALVARGLPLEKTKKRLKLRRGRFAPNSLAYATLLLCNLDEDTPRAYLDEPLCAVFVKFKLWQIEGPAAGSPGSAA